VLWIVVIWRAPNLNYAVFKLAGWTGPGLVLAVWLAAGGGASLRHKLARTLVVPSPWHAPRRSSTAESRSPP
jgi:hypothetical protein